jgi:hypothetical protein
MSISASFVGPIVRNNSVPINTLLYGQASTVSFASGWTRAVDDCSLRSGDRSNTASGVPDVVDGG